MVGLKKFDYSTFFWTITGLFFNEKTGPADGEGILH
jgi:hypothetical protein